eukprot:366203-Chlamydomonas_euryale.AAC.6
MADQGCEFKGGRWRWGKYAEGTGGLHTRRPAWLVHGTSLWHMQCSASDGKATVTLPGCL